MPTTQRPTARSGGSRDGSATSHRPSPRPPSRRLRSPRLLGLAALAAALLLPGTAASAEPTRAEIERRITKESTALARVVEDYNRVNEELKATTAAALRHKTALPGLQTKVQSAEADVRQIAATAYKSGQFREVEALLSASDGNALLDRIGTLDQLARGRQAELDEFTTLRRTYDAERRRLDNLLAKQRLQVRDLKGRKTRIETDLKKLYELRRQAYGQAQESGSRYTGKVPAVSGKAGVAVRFAYDAIGTPYKWAGEGPGGYDCSGLTQAAWGAAGKSLPHNAAMQWDKVAHISRSQLQPGDLVFYSGLGHVGIYVGSSKIIHAPSFGKTVTLAGVDMMTPYGYGRVR
jgi:cell wall-associated NlpC family hydrolase